MLAEQQAEVGQREEAAHALKQGLLQGQQDLERGRAQLGEQRAELAAARAQVCRGAVWQLSANMSHSTTLRLLAPRSGTRSNNR